MKTRDFRPSGAVRLADETVHVDTILDEPFLRLRITYSDVPGEATVWLSASEANQLAAILRQEAERINVQHRLFPISDRAQSGKP